jgi:hypothetical protein
MKSRASKRKDGFGYPPLADYQMRYNVANDMIRVVRWASEAKEEDFNRVFAAYTRPLIALIFACSAIEGYTNYVGQQLMMEDWLAFSKGTMPDQKGRPGIKDKIKRIYAKLGKDASFSSGIFNEVCDLFEKRGYLMHPALDERAFTGEAPPADIVEMIGEDYIPAKVCSLSNKFQEKILEDSQVRDLTSLISYNEKINPA